MEVMLLKINEWLFYLGAILLIVSGFILLFSLKRGLRLSEYFTPGPEIYRDLSRYVRSDRILIVKYSAVIGAVVLMSAVLLLVVRAVWGL
jgi:hypothetical protein